MDTLHVNGEKQKDSLPMPTPCDLIYISGEEITEAEVVSFKEAVASEDGSKFIVKAAKVDSLENCRKLYRARLLNPSNMI